MGIARPVMENFPYAWAFFVPFILVATFTMLNLFIAIIVNAMQSYNEAEQQGAKQAVEAARVHIEADLHAEMQALRNEIRALQSMLSGAAETPSRSSPDTAVNERTHHDHHTT